MQHSFGFAGYWHYDKLSLILQPADMYICSLSVEVPQVQNEAGYDLSWVQTHK